MPQIIGVDLGSRFVKVVRINYQRKPQIVEAFMFDTPYASDSFPNSELDKNELINKLVSKIPLKVLRRSYIGVNISSSLVVVLKIKLPKMSKKELGVASIIEAKRKMIPPPGPESIFEYLILREEVRDKTGGYEVLVVRTEKDYVRGILDIFRVLEEVRPFFVTPTCYTILRLFPPSVLCNLQDTAFVDIGYTSLDIAIAKRGKLHFYRNVKFGLRDIIARISQTMGVSFQETERIIIEEGIPQIDIEGMDRIKIAEEIMRQKYEEVDKVKRKIIPLELRMLWQSDVDRIVQEIRRTLAYYKEKIQGERVENLFFMGGGAKIKGLVELLDKNMGGRIQSLKFENDPLSWIDREKCPRIADEISMFAPAISLALNFPYVGKRGRDINFLPLELKKHEIILRRKVSMVILGMYLVVFSFLGWFKLSIDNQKMRNRLREIEAELTQRPEVMRTLKLIKYKESLIEKKLQVIESLRSQKINYPKLLGEIANRLPHKVFINNFTIMRIERSLSKREEGFSLEDSEEQGERGGFGASPPQLKENYYRMTLTAAAFVTYEELERLVRDFRKSLQEVDYLQNIEITLPELERISPTIGSSKKVVLTKPLLRKFQIQADIINRKEKK